MTPRKTVIDSGSPSIQLPESEFNRLVVMMVDKDNSIVKKEKENSKILMSRTTSCEDLSKILDPLYIAIEDKLITI